MAGKVVENPYAKDAAVTFALICAAVVLAAASWFAWRALAPMFSEEERRAKACCEWRAAQLSYEYSVEREGLLGMPALRHRVCASGFGCNAPTTVARAKTWSELNDALRRDGVGDETAEQCLAKLERKPAASSGTDALGIRREIEWVKGFVKRMTMEGER